MAQRSEVIDERKGHRDRYDSCILVLDHHVSVVDWDDHFGRSQSPGGAAFWPICVGYGMDRDVVRPVRTNRVQAFPGPAWNSGQVTRCNTVLKEKKDGANPSSMSCVHSTTLGLGYGLEGDEED